MGTARQVESEACEICGSTKLNCGCAECQWCGEIANMDCYTAGHLNEPDREAAIANAREKGEKQHGTN